MNAPEQSLAHVLANAKAYWGNTPSGSIMAIRAARCVAHLDALGFTSSAKVLCDAPGSYPSQLLSALGRGSSSKDGRQVFKPLAPESVCKYYSAFKRALRLSGLNPVGWVSPPKPPRTVKRDPISDDDFHRLLGWMDAKGYQETAALAILLAGTGLRIGVEGLREFALSVSPGDAFDTLSITGKGGHERIIPVVEAATRRLLGDRARMDRLRAIPYRTHLRRWNKALQELQIKSKLATPHSVRHRYATDALSLSGGNLAMVQELLGHASPATTKRYLHVDLSAKAAMLALGATTGDTS